MMSAKQSINRDSIIDDIKRIALKKRTAQLTRSDFCAETGISPSQIYNHFEGWREATKLAGLEPHYQNVSVSDDDLFEEMRRIFHEDGICTRTKFGKLSKYGLATYKRHFGRWEEVLLAFRKWIENKKITFPWFEQLPSGLTQKKKAKSITSEPFPPYLISRGMLRPPRNHDGVILLFGMICSELGFIVEDIRSFYPDCKAKRFLNKERTKPKSVRIEFEFKSSYFKGHKPKDCDIIVCWEHDWTKCPDHIEVIALKEEIRKLQQNQGQNA